MPVSSRNCFQCDQLFLQEPQVRKGWLLPGFRIVCFISNIIFTLAMRTYLRLAGAHPDADSAAVPWTLPEVCCRRHSGECVTTLLPFCGLPPATAGRGLA